MFCISYLISRGRITGNKYSRDKFTLEPRTGQLNFRNHFLRGASCCGGRAFEPMGFCRFFIPRRASDEVTLVGSTKSNVTNEKSALSASWPPPLSDGMVSIDSKHWVAYAGRQLYFQSIHMKSKLNAFIALSLVVASCLIGCGKSDSLSVSKTPAPGSAPTGLESETDSGPPSDVTIASSESPNKSIRLLRAEGAFNPSAHDRQNSFEFPIAGSMNYRVRISCAPWVGKEWCINPLVDITNPSESTLYVKYYSAFYNHDGQLVGCCNQDANLGPSETPLQLGSLVVRGSKEQLLTATRFQIVIYESDKRIGSQPIDQKTIASLVGRSGKVISELKQTNSSVARASDHAELRLQADISFDDPVGKRRNTHLRIEGAGEYDVYVSTRLRNVLETNVGRANARFDRWESDVEFEAIKRVKGVSAIAHAALHDQSGRLIACSATSSTRQLAAPEDILLSAEKLDLVVYESVRE
ncbi:MAG: hypothetical protein F9B45_22190 [Phycisphaera sp. RhM]|nr:hypothetical protein [Phycisphaera sp. RhM]